MNILDRIELYICNDYEADSVSRQWIIINNTKIPEKILNGTAEATIEFATITRLCNNQNEKSVYCMNSFGFKIRISVWC